MIDLFTTDESANDIDNREEQKYQHSKNDATIYRYHAHDLRCCGNCDHMNDRRCTHHNIEIEGDKMCADWQFDGLEYQVGCSRRLMSIEELKQRSEFLQYKYRGHEI